MLKAQAPLIQHPAATEYFFAEGCFIIEWWNAPADADLSVARARVEPGVTTRWHRLRGVTERYLILDGRGWVDVGDLPPEAVGVFYRGDGIVGMAGGHVRIEGVVFAGNAAGKNGFAALHKGKKVVFQPPGRFFRRIAHGFALLSIDEKGVRQA